MKSLEEKAVTVIETQSEMTDINKMADALGDSKTNEEVKEALDADPTADPGQNTARKGIKDWRARLNDMRQRKAAVKESLNESKSGIETLGSESASFKEAFAPTAGLQKDEKGALKIDKEKVEEKKEIEFEARKEPDIAAAVAKKDTRSALGSVIS